MITEESCCNGAAYAFELALTFLSHNRLAQPASRRPQNAVSNKKNITDSAL